MHEDAAEAESAPVCTLALPLQVSACVPTACVLPPALSRQACHPPRPPPHPPPPSASLCLWTGGVPAPCGVNMTRKCAPRDRGVAPPAGPSAKRTRARRVLHTGAASIALSVRAFFQREFVTGRATKRRQVAESTAEATVLSLSDNTHHTESGCGEMPADGAPETQHSIRRVPHEELARVRPAIDQQYRIPLLPTLNSTLKLLNVGGSAHALVWLLQCISRVPPRGAPRECAIPNWRRTVERLVLHRLRLHRPFRGKGNGQALCAAKSLRPGLLFVQFGINRSIQCSAVLPARFFGYFGATRVHCKTQCYRLCAPPSCLNEITVRSCS